MKATFGRYVLLKKIAVGGMAEIFLARRLSHGGFAKFVVLKRLLPEHRGKPAFEQLFLSEARIAAMLHHPNVVSVYDLGKLKDAYFIAMEHVHGPSGAELLSRAMKRGLPVPLGVAIRIVIAVADALHYGVTALGLDSEPLGVLHHDVSPHNIQLSFLGDAKLLDYGVATQMGRPAPEGRRGKFAYMSPETTERRPVDARSDLYSLGVVLFELALTRRLFKGETPADTKALAAERIIPRPTALDPYFPASLEEVLLKALAPDAAARFEHCGAFADALRDTSRRLGVDTSAEGTANYLIRLFGDEIEARRRRVAKWVERKRGRMLDEDGGFKDEDDPDLEDALVIANDLEEAEHEREPLADSQPPNSEDGEVGPELDPLEVENTGAPLAVESVPESALGSTAGSTVEAPESAQAGRSSGVWPLLTLAAAGLGFLVGALM